MSPAPVKVSGPPTPTSPSRVSLEPAVPEPMVAGPPDDGRGQPGVAVDAVERALACGAGTAQGERFGREVVEGAGELQRGAALDGGAARRGAQRPVGGDLQHAGVDGGQAGVGVGRRQHQRAAARLGQARARCALSHVVQGEPGVARRADACVARQCDAAAERKPLMLGQRGDRQDLARGQGEGAQAGVLQAVAKPNEEFSLTVTTLVRSAAEVTTLNRPPMAPGLTMRGPTASGVRSMVGTSAEPPPTSACAAA